MVLDISGAVFYTFRGFQKSQIFGLAIAGRNGLSVEIHQILAEVDNFFLDGVYISVKLLRTRPVSRVCRLNALYRFVNIFK